MDGTVFPPCSLAWGQTMVGVMATSSNRTYASMPCIPDCCSQCIWPRGRPLLTHASSRDSQTLTDRSVSVSCGVIASFFWVLVHIRFLFVPSKSLCFPVLWKSCNQIPLAFKVKFPEDSQFLCWTPRLGNLLWGLDILMMALLVVWSDISL